MKHKGSCHCGNVAFEVEGDIVHVVEVPEGLEIVSDPRSATQS